MYREAYYSHVHINPKRTHDALTNTHSYAKWIAPQFLSFLSSLSLPLPPSQDSRLLAVLDSLFRLGWSQTLPAPASRMLGLKTCATHYTRSSSHLNSYPKRTLSRQVWVQISLWEPQCLSLRYSLNLTQTFTFPTTLQNLCLSFYNVSE